LTRGQVGDGRADSGSSEVFHAFIMAHFGTEVKGVTRPSQVRETALFREAQVGVAKQFVNPLHLLFKELHAI
jgi:hypothetical protein